MEQLLLNALWWTHSRYTAAYWSSERQDRHYNREKAGTHFHQRIPPLVQICIRGIDKLIAKGNDSMIAVVGKNGSSIPAQLPHSIGNCDITLRVGGIQRQTVGIDHNRHSGTRTVVALIRNVYNPGLLRIHFRKDPGYKNHCRCTCLHWNRKPVHCGQNTDRSFRRSTAVCTEKYH